MSGVSLTRAEIYDNAWAAEIGAKPEYLAALAAAHRFAQVTHAKPGTNVIQWLLERSAAADQAALSAISLATGESK